MLQKSIRSLAVCSLFAGAVMGDTLVLRNGSQVSGKLISAQNGSISFSQAGGQNRRFNMNEVGRIEFNNAGENNQFNSDYYGNDTHSRYDQYRDRPDYRNNQPQGGAISAKYQDMSRAGIGLGQPMSAEQASQDAQGRFRVYENGTIYWSPQSGAHEVHGAIREQYLRIGAENSRLGYPVSDEVAAPDGVGRVTKFEHGSIYWSARSGGRVDSAR
jgi:hypothetical protein